MFDKIKTIAAASALALTATVSTAQPFDTIQEYPRGDCIPFEVGAEFLSVTFGEFPVQEEVEVREDGSVLIMFRNFNTGTWTRVHGFAMVGPDGENVLITCLVDHD